MMSSENFCWIIFALFIKNTLCSSFRAWRWIIKVKTYARNYMCKMCVYSYIYMGEVVYLGTEFLVAQRIPSGLWEPKRKKNQEIWGSRESLIWWRKIYRTVLTSYPRWRRSSIGLKIKGNWSARQELFLHCVLGRWHETSNTILESW